MARHNELGKQGEQWALQFLKAKGYTILETNWRHEKEEVDIIARDKDELVIVEVKTRSTDAFGDPEEAVTPQKARRLIEAAGAYVEQHQLDMDIRFDVIAILFKNGKKVIHHIEDAFYAADFQ
ncbi:YraN family protein [Candidatus Sulfidibacterium hydrothermale]|uniref:YraN family protein n=1 Tax=Candidatus Sulfidibacterium hydrothermale TaxID=2875962 RepID=UPI001F0B4AC5|nr:YraN family protein [Candidatus Sulfidibacterium hydrothermale]UBM62532.1 YraN family protein [Candidatus Sulfidibacterium hydrothermale]